MEEIKIPHAVKALIVKSHFPIEELHVWTRLPEHSPAGPEADARHDMLQAIASEVIHRNLSGRRVMWSFDIPRNSRGER